ncbi:hypothetical protein X801_02286 [Opisthorchis viverrini]|uniref:Uncharacterized protein n=1 Tax=Opisthorchis viverrini TaxID=6198 RepID=A0A1S8X510_OPIVI|nr:hypothetical protein X801_02286 [Opisthorchis viverrini]
MSVVTTIPTESKTSGTGAEQAVDLCQLINEATSENTERNSGRNSYFWSSKGRPSFVERHGSFFTTGQALPDWLQRDFEQLFESGSKLEEICRILPISRRYARKLVQRIRSKKRPKTPPTNLEIRDVQEMDIPNDMVSLNQRFHDKTTQEKFLIPSELRTGDHFDNFTKVVQSDPIVIEDDEDIGGHTTERRISGTKSPSSSLQLTSTSVTSSITSSLSSIHMTVSCASTGPTIARVTSLCQPNIQVSQASYIFALKTRPTPIPCLPRPASGPTISFNQCVPISMVIPNSTLGVPGFTGLGNTVLIMKTQTEPKWLPPTANEQPNSSSSVMLPIQSTACASLPTPSTNNPHPKLPSQPNTPVSTLPSAPISLNTCTSLWPGQIHRLLLNNPDSESNGAHQNSDLAIVYLGHNCWRPVILPRGFQAVGQLGSLRTPNKSAVATAPDSTPLFLYNPS